jgi:hypothetical protein
MTMHEADVHIGSDACLHTKHVDRNKVCVGIMSFLLIMRGYQGDNLLYIVRLTEKLSDWSMSDPGHGAGEQQGLLAAFRNGVRGGQGNGSQRYAFPYP